MRKLWGKLHRAVLLAAAGVFWLHAAAWATDPLPTPTGPVVLSVTGKITRTNADGMANFDMAMLDRLGRKIISTSTPWTDGTQEFGGVLVRDVLDAAGARGETVDAIALNDYSYTIRIKDFRDYPVLIASTLNGEPMRVRDKGPLWIIYPMDQFKELRKPEIEYRMVWQLRTLDVK